ncbi:MAG: hypothetical protein IJT95_06010, partial [Abditibacteriota bacterium]|nr:hypothetical protein [Abditibacteriota bacterium]
MRRILVIALLLLLALPALSRPAMDSSGEEGLVFTENGSAFDKITLWDESISENNGFVASGYMSEGRAVVSWDKLRPGQKLRVKVFNKNSIVEEYDVSPSVPVSVNLLHTGWLNGARSVSSEYTVRTLFGGELFGGSPAEYRPELARLGITLCGASYLRGGKPDTEALGGLLESMGFEDIEKFNYYGSEQTERSDRAGIYLAHRKIFDGSREKELVMCVVRGTVAGEWFSNFDVGDTGAHKGFAAAAGDGALHVRTYLAEHHIPKGSTVMLTGHSRGAAVAEIMSLGMDMFGFDKVFCYVYACPNYTKRPMRDKPGRFAMMFEGDLVPAIPMWGFSTDGAVINSENFTPEEKECLRERFTEISGGVKFVAFSAAEKDKIVKSITDLAPNVTAFYQKVYSKRGLLKKVTPMTTYEFCVAMGKA